MLASPLHISGVDGQDFEQSLTIGRGRNNFLFFALWQLLQSRLRSQSESSTANLYAVGELQWPARAQVLCRLGSAAAMILQPTLDVGGYSCVERVLGGADEIKVPVLHAVAVRRMFAKDYRTSKQP